MSARTARCRRGHPDASSTPSWRNRIAGHRLVPPDELLPHPANWRRHPIGQRHALDSVLRDVGWVQDVIVSARTGRILDGHARVEEAIAHGEPTVPVTDVDLDEREERLILTVFDPIGSIATPDPDALRDLLADLGPMDASLAALLDDLAAASGATPGALVDPDDAPALPDEANTYVRRGDLWRLGSHRLLCGDALNADDVHRLVGPERPRLLATDPPYGVNLDLARRHALSGPSAGRRGTGHRRAQLAGDARADWSEAFELAPSLDVAYIWRPFVHSAEVGSGLERIGFELVSEIVWAKARWVVGRRWYHWAHESCLVARRRGARLRFLGGRDQGTVWEAASPKVAGSGADTKVDHPTQKPVELFERPIRNHLPPGEVVYDPFVGSGTTLIAAERSRRRCLAMELDPGFVQVAIERWQRLTGHRAERIGEAL